MKRRILAFTLTEMILAIALLSLLIVFVAGLFGSASNITSLAARRMDVDSELRTVFNRLDVDIARMVKRSDVAAHAKVQGGPQAGNDLISFYSLVDGFFPITTILAEKRQPQTTLITYRISSSQRLERMAKGLAFAGQHSTPPLLFGTANTIAGTWPNATSATAADSDYSVVAAGIFRFEYYFILKGTGGTSETPWVSIQNINLTDIAAIAVSFAAIDPKSRTLLSDAEIGTLATSLADYQASFGTNGLLSDWQQTIDANPSLPRKALSNIRLYQRIFPF